MESGTMASVKKRGDTYRIRYRLPGEKNPRSYTVPRGTTKRASEKLAGEIQLAIDQDGSWAPASAPPLNLEELANSYIEERSRGTTEKAAARPKTLSLYRAVLVSGLMESCRGNGPAAPGLHTLSKDAVRRFLEGKREAGCEQSTLSSYARAISPFWRWAHERHPEHVAKPDMPGVHVPPTKQVLAPTWVEIDRMVEQITDRASTVRRAVTIARYSGLRIKQAAAPTWADFDPDWEGLGPALHVTEAKSEHETAMDRWVPLAPGLTRCLLEWRGAAEDSEPIIGGILPRDPHETVGGAWRRAGVPEDRWRRRPDHALRKRFISHLVEAGASDAAIDYLVGHAPKGTRARHYVDPRALWPMLRAAVGTVPAIGESGTASTTGGSGVAELLARGAAVEALTATDHELGRLFVDPRLQALLKLRAEALAQLGRSEEAKALLQLCALGPQQ